MLRPLLRESLQQVPLLDNNQGSQPLWGMDPERRPAL